MDTDQTIWEDFKKGKSYALKHIYDQHIHLLFRYGKKFSKDDEVIKDSIQDLFFDLIRIRENLGNTDNIKFYLIKSFRRKLIQNMKKQQLYDGGDVERISNVESVSSFEGELILREERAGRAGRVRESLEKLSEKQREILFYRFHCEFSYEQICDIMSLKYDSARKLSFRALKVLKEYLSGDQENKK